MAVQPPQRFELDDLAHVEREARTIYAPGATPGDVLVVQSDHSLVAAPGGGSMPGGLVTIERQAAYTFVAPYGNTYIDGWDHAYDLDGNPLVSLPPELGLTVPLDLSEGEITATEDGTWLVAFLIVPEVDATGTGLFYLNMTGQTGSPGAGGPVNLHAPTVQGGITVLGGGPVQMRAGQALTLGIGIDGVTANPYTVSTYCFVQVIRLG